MDSQTTLGDLKALVDNFMDERDWKQFHSPKSMAMDIVCEASELMEPFIWVSSEESYKTIEEKRQEIEAELADTIMGCLRFASLYNIDISNALKHKITLAAQKYPVDKAKGKNKKYTEL